jgi:transporter family-2 protein
MSGYAMVMFAAGLGIPTLAALNAALGRHIDSPFGASTLLFSVALLCAITVSLAAGGFSPGKLVTAPKHLFLAGVLIAFYVVSITYVAPLFGLGNAIFFVLLGQIVSATIIDHFGLFNAPVVAINYLRVCGIILMVIGIWLTQVATTLFAR